MEIYMKKFVIILGLCLILLVPVVGCGGNQSNLESKKETAIAVVHSTAVGLGAVLGNYQDESDRISFIRAYVDPVRFYSDQTGYLFVYYFDCVNIALPNPKELE